MDRRCILGVLVIVMMLWIGLGCDHQKQDESDNITQINMRTDNTTIRQ